MHQARTWLLIGLIALGGFGCGDDDPRNVAATATATALPSPTVTATATHLNTATATFTATGTVTATATFTATQTPSPTATATPTGAMAMFSADPLNPSNPFPSDRLLDDTGHVHVTAEIIAADLPSEARFDRARLIAHNVAQQATALTGFSTFAPIRVKFDSAVTIADSMHPDGILVFEYANPSVTAAIAATAVTPDVSGDVALEIQPVVPLHPKTKYVYVVTRAVHDAQNYPVHGSADLAAALRGDPGSSTWRATLEPALQSLHDQRGIGIDDIAAIDFFTTQPITDDLIAIKHLFDSAALPVANPVFENSPIVSLETGIFPEGTPEFADLIGSSTSPNVAAVGIGSFDSFDFRTGPNGAFDPAKVAGEVTPTVHHLDFYMTIPKAPAPPNGYPITIFGHGLGQSGRDAVTISRLVGDAPMIGIGISAVEHGRRGSVANFFVIANGLVTRERFRQTIADFLQLERMIRHATVPPFDQVDKSRVNYLGVSLGGIMGTLYMGIEPDVGTGMLSVPGGGLPNILASPFIGTLLDPLIAATVNIPVDDPLFPVFLHRFKQLAQWFLDPGDPINTAPFIIDPDRHLPGIPPKRILMHEGIVDDIVPNRTTDDLALAMGLPDVKVARGCTSANGCNGIWRFVMSEYGQDPSSGHGVTGSVSQAGAQAGHYIVSDGQEILDASP